MAYPLALALQNFMPVLLSAAALWNLVRMMERDGSTAARLTQLAAAMIIVGGAAKAVWKLLMSLSNQDVPLLSGALFPLIAPGFALLALPVLHARRRGATIGIGLIAATIAVSIGIAAAGSSGWKMPLLTLLTAGMLACGVGLVQRARAAGDSVAALLVALYVAVSFMLSGIAVAGSGTLAMQWTEQMISTLGAAALLWAAVRMRVAASEAIA